VTFREDGGYAHPYKTGFIQEFSSFTPGRRFRLRVRRNAQVEVIDPVAPKPGTSEEAAPDAIPEADAGADAGGRAGAGSGARAGAGAGQRLPKL